MIINGLIDGMDTKPRHLWDLYANRVVPWWSVKKWVISLAWVDERDHEDTMTPINGYEWMAFEGGMLLQRFGSATEFESGRL